MSYCPDFVNPRSEKKKTFKRSMQQTIFEQKDYDRYSPPIDATERDYAIPSHPYWLPNQFQDLAKGKLEKSFFGGVRMLLLPNFNCVLSMPAHVNAGLCKCQNMSLEPICNIHHLSSMRSCVQPHHCLRKSCAKEPHASDSEEKRKGSRNHKDTKCGFA